MTIVVVLVLVLLLTSMGRLLATAVVRTVRINACPVRADARLDVAVVQWHVAELDVLVPPVVLVAMPRIQDGVESALIQPTPHDA